MSQNESIPVKITRPRISGVVQRERLFRLLDSGRTKPVTWVSGPAGSGKTTLVASYLDSRGIPCLWYQVDEGDADPASFFYYLGLAANKAAPQAPKPLPLLTPEFLPGISTFAKRYFETLSHRLKPPFLIVLDNYQELAAGSAMHEVIQQGVTGMPEGAGVVIICRTEPVPAFARLTANSQLLSLTADNLRFTENESREFIERKGRKKVPDQVITELHSRTQGWAAGLVLFLEMARTDGGGNGLAGQRPPEEVFHYFAGELFDKAEPDMQRFLLRTAFLPAISLTTAESLAGIRNAGRILEELTRKNFFIIKRSNPDPEYQYHPLFREFLQTRAEERFSPEELAALQKETAAILERSGHGEDAIRLYGLVGDWKGFIPAVLSAAPSLIRQGRNRTLREWIEKIPAPVRGANPWLLFWSGVCGIAVAPAESRSLFERAFRLFEAAGDETGTLLSWSTIVQTYIFELHDLRPLDPWISWIDERIRRGLSFASPEIEASVVTGMTGILAWRMPARPDKDLWLERAFALPNKTSNMDSCVRAYTNSAIFHVWMGDFAQGGLLINAMRTMIESQPVSPLRLITLKVIEAMVYNSSSDFREQAAQSVADGLSISRDTGVSLMFPTLYLQGAVSALNKGNAAEALIFLQKAERVVGVDRQVYLSQYFLLSSWHDLVVGNASRALVSARKSLRLIEGAGVPAAEALIRLAAVHALYESGERREATEQLARTKSQTSQTGSAHLEFLSALTEAYFSLDGNDRPGGLEALRRAMKTGQQKDYVTMAYFWRPSVMSRLCGEALAAGIEVEYVHRLVRKLDLAPPDPLEDVELWPWRFDFSALGGFELRVDGKPLTFAGKTQKKPIDLLKALIVFGGREVAEHQLSEALWPDAEGDLARRSFDTTLHRLRKMLGDDRSVLINEGKLTLNPCLWRVDVWTFERIFSRIEDLLRSDGNAAPRQNKKPGASAAPQIASLLDNAVRLYKGHFLASDADQPWTMSPRERLQSKFLRLIVKAGGYFEEAGDYEKARDLFRKGLDIDNLVEEFYQHLMLCCDRLGRKSEALSLYHQCRTVLAAALGIAPSQRTEEIYSSLMGKR